MQPVNFYSLIENLDRMGVWDVFLPFMLVFTLVYATLTTTVWTDQKKFAKVVSMVIGLGVVVPHVTNSYPPGMNVVKIINSALPNVALIAVAILGFFILLGLFGIKPEKFANGNIMMLVVLFCLGSVIYVFGSAGGSRYGIPPALSFLTHPDTMAMLITLGVFGIVVWFITREPKSGNDNGMAKKIGDVKKALFGDD